MANFKSSEIICSFDHIFKQISAFDCSLDDLPGFYADLKDAQKEAKEKSQTVVLDYAGPHSLHVYPTGLIQLMYAGPLYELVE